jgi:hypothetical protein
VLDGGAVDWTGTVCTGCSGLCFRCIDDVAVESVDVTRANQRGAGASLHALDCEAVKAKGGEEQGLIRESDVEQWD